MAVAPERGGSKRCCGRGCADGFAESASTRGEGGRRLPRRVVNLSAALRRRRGRYYFLLFPPPPSPLLPFSFSRSFWSQRVFARSGRLRRSLPRSSGTHLFEVARVVLLPRPLSVRLVLTRSFDATLRVSIHLRILLRSFVRSQSRTASEVARSRLQRSLMRVHSFPLSLSSPFFLFG